MSRTFSIVGALSLSAAFVIGADTAVSAQTYVTQFGLFNEVRSPPKTSELQVGIINVAPMRNPHSGWPYRSEPVYDNPVCTVTHGPEGVTYSHECFGRRGRYSPRYERYQSPRYERYQNRRRRDMADVTNDN
jgi:hypothetical protein